VSVRVAKTRIVSLAPVGYYADNSPIYKFNTSFPTSGVKSLKKGLDNLSDAEVAAEEVLKKHTNDNFPCGMGEVIGAVQKSNGKYYGVVNLYRSKS
tara:strand:- start:6772 stop:7059 length:288 start_codon:yes stop_codon:yes gene_type:complete